MNERGSIRVGAAALALAAAACAAPGQAVPSAAPTAAFPAYLDDPVASPHPGCAPAGSFLAVGSSSAGRSEAEARARAAVVRNISSAIDVETTRIIETSLRAGKFNQDRQLRERSRDRAHFEYAHLIRAVGSPGQRGGEIFVLACLDRAEAARALLADLEPKFLHFRASSDRAAAGAAGGDRATFALSYRDAVADEPELVALLAEYRTLAGVDADAGSEFMKRWHDLDATAVRVRNDVLLRLTMDGGALAPDLTDEVSDSVRTALAGYGLKVEIAPGCPEVAAPVLLLQLRADPACRWGTLGYACGPNVTLRALDCASGQTLFEGPLAETALTGIDVRDPSRALRRSVEKASAAAFAPDLRRMLAAQIPLPPEAARSAPP